MNDSESLTFWEHLDVLRGSVIRMLVAAVTAGVVAFLLKDRIFDVVLAPAGSDFVTYRLLGTEPFRIELVNTGLTEQFMIHMKVSLVAGVLAAYKSLANNIQQYEPFPNRWMDGEKELTNLMVVASSDKEGNPSMNANYGAKELDLFAPGINIYSTYIGDTYRTGSGTGLSAATVAGVAALVKAYYPELTGTQIREVLLQSVTRRPDAEVEKGILVGGKQDKDLFLFEELCLSGGIVNAYQAVVAADKLVNQ